MKKSLLAVAAMTAFAGAAQAQSSVTVYGIMDVGYTNGSASFTSATATNKQNVSRISNSMESGSRIGFRGTEDLGGGTSANFVYELGIQPAGNAGSNASGETIAAPTASSGSNAGSPNQVFNTRQAYVGLVKKGLVDVRIGTQNTFNWEQAGSNTTGQLNQTLGSMLAPTTDGAFFNSASVPSTATAALNGSAYGAFTNRTTNTITARSDRMAGVQAKLGAVLSNQDSTRTSATNGGNSNQFGWMGALDWNIQKANIQASYQVFHSEAPVGGAATYTTTPAAWGSGTQGNNVIDGQALITGSYDFGILKAYAGWVNRKVQADNNPSLFLKRSAQEIGVRSFITPTIEGWASVGNGRYTSYGVGAPTANIIGYQLGGNYWLSKRTNLYTIYG
ncbi:porin, partial [Polynucleobacter sp. MWH-Berg-3C6]|uniref:porin n=1 Tax=Polynucleobacter sp. MWH-Berg-3C6 TaxID=1855882 RepID=UPI001C0B7E39